MIVNYSIDTETEMRQEYKKPKRGPTDNQIVRKEKKRYSNPPSATRKEKR